MPYTYQYPRPAVTVDAIVIRKNNGEPEVLLIERKNPPFKGYWALPGGFVDENEDLYVASKRELQEETSITNFCPKQFFTAGKPGRDPRGHNISVIFWDEPTGILNAVAADDAACASWFPLNQLPKMAFDHSEILERFIRFYQAL